MISKRVIGILFLIIACLVCLSGVFGLSAGPTALQGRIIRSARSDRAPVIRIDKQGYLAGEKVRISGAGFSPFERVMLRVAHTDGTVEANMGHEPWFINADSAGSFKTTWSLNSNDTAGVGLALEAAGLSGLSAHASFTRRGEIRTNRLSYQPGDTARTPQTVSAQTNSSPSK